MKPFFVYMLRCRDDSYYVGHTDELEKRMAEHRAGTFGGHTARNRPVTLVWSLETETRDEALRLEMQLKGWGRGKKEALIRGDWAALERLARGPNRGEQRPPEGAPFDSAPGCAGRYAQGERGGAAPGCAGRYAQGERAGAAPGCAGRCAQGERAGADATAQRMADHA